MEEYTREEIDSAKKLLEFYVGLVESNNSAARFYLAENVVLDWFGKTIKDSKKVSQFIKDHVCQVTHHLTNVFPSENVGFKDSHRIKVPNSEVKLLFPVTKGLITPPKQNEASTSMKEMGQGDGIHNTITSPPKKMKFTPEEEDNETVESEIEPTKLKYLTAEGSIEFHKPSIKKLQAETRWKRPSKLHLGYTTSSFKDCTIYLIIYEGNLKCRRNLYKEFCESDNNTKTSV